MKLHDILEAGHETHGKLSPAVLRLIHNARTGKADWEDVIDKTYDELFGYFMNTGEMSYGTMKARDGDPYQWIMDKLSNMSDFEFKQFVRINREYQGQRAQAKPIGA